MKIIITAAGQGKRFVKEGIKIPKYLINVNGKTLLEHSLLTLTNFYNNEFIFIFRNLKNEKEIEKIIQNCKNNKNEKINNYKIINIENITRGQAETVLCAKSFLNDNDSILIFNIDTCILDASKLIKEEDINQFVDGIIYTTKAEGDHWSFAKTLPNSNVVIEVSEKIRISNHASIGLYYFKKFKDFFSVLKKYNNEIIKKYKELYIMPIYQYLINDKQNIIIKDIPLCNFIPLGTPDEIINIDQNFIMENKNV
ncbi:sugar phosphate nucleotidyltransferase [Malacoplasma muris]|uniref:sugar phosphate nucleotidyltransferase n=1 Tax=Malacoplasma muris TaxID=2119 RepID=UPI00398E55B3